MTDIKITQEQVDALFDRTYRMGYLSHAYADVFPEAENSFRPQWAGLRDAIDIIGLKDQYLRYAIDREAVQRLQTPPR